MGPSLYKVGDKVEVIVRQSEASAYRFNFADEMLKYVGQIVTIANVGIPSCRSDVVPDDGYRYKIFEDGGEYYWASSMFRPLVDIMSLANNAANDTPTTIKIKVKTKQLKFNFKN